MVDEINLTLHEEMRLCRNDNSEGFEARGGMYAAPRSIQHHLAYVVDATACRCGPQHVSVVITAEQCGGLHSTEFHVDRGHVVISCDLRQPVRSGHSIG